MPERKIAYERSSQQKNTVITLTAPSYERLFIDAALAMTDFRFPQDLIEVKESRKVQVKGKNLNELFIDWINTVFALSKNERFIAKRIVFESFNGNFLIATLHGEIHNPLKHGGVDSVASFVTAATTLNASENGFQAQLQFGIG